MIQQIGCKKSSFEKEVSYVVSYVTYFVITINRLMKQKKKIHGYRLSVNNVDKEH